MAAPSRPPTFKEYAVERRCYGCRRPVKATEHLWFTGFPVRGVFGLCCFGVAARYGKEAKAA